MVNLDLHKKVLDYLRNHNVITLATHGPEGIWAAAVFYVNDHFNLYFLSAPASRHVADIASNPSVAATVQEDYADWREIKGIQLEGKVKRIEGVERAAAVARYARKFPIAGNSADMPKEILGALSRIIWFKLVPTRIYFIDNSQGFGHRDEVILKIRAS